MTIDAVREAELAVLGAIVGTQGRALDDVALDERDFLQPLHGALFSAARARYNNGGHVDVLTLADEFPRDAAFVHSLADHTPFAAAVEYYAQIVSKHALRRRLAAVGTGLAHMDESLTEGELSDTAVRMVDDAVGEGKAPVRFVGDYLPDVVESLRSEDVFVRSPWESLDKVIGGFRPGAVYVVAARPGVGKTVVAGQIAVQLAQHGIVAFSSLEMTGQELTSRLMSERLNIRVGRIKNARLQADDWRRLESDRDRLDRLNIAIDDRSGVGPSDVRAFARSVSKRGRLSGVVVDYLQLMTAPGKQDRHVQVAEFSRQLKILAKDLQVPVIALSQLNRNSEQSEMRVPRLSDLRESGAIEQDADCVMLLRREEGHTFETMWIDVAKNRHGRTGEIGLRWDGTYSRAVDDFPPDQFMQ